MQSLLSFIEIHRNELSDIEKYGKNPWLITEKNLECNPLKDGDTVKIGKKRTIVIGEEA